MKEADRFGDLIIIRKNGQIGTNYPITDHIYIGRSHKCQLVIDLKNVSKVNTLLFIQNDQVYVRSLSKICPTLINGEIIHDDILLKDNDVISISNRMFQFKTVSGSKQNLTYNEKPSVPIPESTLDNTILMNESDINMEDSERIKTQRNSLINPIEPKESPRKPLFARRLSSVLSHSRNITKRDTNQDSDDEFLQEIRHSKQEEDRLKARLSMTQLLLTPRKALPSQLEYIMNHTPSNSLQLQYSLRKSMNNTPITPRGVKTTILHPKDTHEDIQQLPTATCKLTYDDAEPETTNDMQGESMNSDTNTVCDQRAIIIKKKHTGIAKESTISPIKHQIVKHINSLSNTPLKQTKNTLHIHPSQGQLLSPKRNLFSPRKYSAFSPLKVLLTKNKIPAVCVTRTRTELKEGLHPDIQQALNSYHITPSPAKSIHENKEEQIDMNKEDTSILSSPTKSGLPSELVQAIRTSIDSQQLQRRLSGQMNDISVEIPNIKYYYIDDEDKLKETTSTDNSKNEKPVFNENDYEYIETIEHSINPIEKEEENEWTTITKRDSQVDVYTGSHADIHEDIKEIINDLPETIANEDEQQTNKEHKLETTITDNISIHSNEKPIFEEYYTHVEEAPKEDDIICVPIKPTSIHSVLRSEPIDDPVYLKHNILWPEESDSQQNTNDDNQSNNSASPSKKVLKSSEQSTSTESIPINSINAPVTEMNHSMNTPNVVVTSPVSTDIFEIPDVASSPSPTEVTTTSISHKETPSTTVNNNTSIQTDVITNANNDDNTNSLPTNTSLNPTTHVTPNTPTTSINSSSTKSFTNVNTTINTTANTTANTNVAPSTIPQLNSYVSSYTVPSTYGQTGYSVPSMIHNTYPSSIVANPVLSNSMNVPLPLRTVPYPSMYPPVVPTISGLPLPQPDTTINQPPVPELFTLMSSTSTPYLVPSSNTTNINNSQTETTTKPINQQDPVVTETQVKTTTNEPTTTSTVPEEDKTSEESKVNPSTMTCSICSLAQTSIHNKIILCTKCQKPFHKKCVGLSKLPTYEWYCSTCLEDINKEMEDNTKTEVEDVPLTPCIVCKHDTNTRFNQLFPCNTCHHCYHKKCAGLKRLPAEDWECVDCKRKRQSDELNEIDAFVTTSKHNPYKDFKEVINDDLCMICHKYDYSLYNPAVICDNCQGSYHQNCLNLNRIPRRFICPRCQRSYHSHSTKSTRKNTSALTPNTTISYDSLNQLTVVTIRSEIRKLNGTPIGLKAQLVEQLFDLIQKKRIAEQKEPLPPSLLLPKNNSKSIQSTSSVISSSSTTKPETSSLLSSVVDTNLIRNLPAVTTTLSTSSISSFIPPLAMPLSNTPIPSTSPSPPLHPTHTNSLPESSSLSLSTQTTNNTNSTINSLTKPKDTMNSTIKENNTLSIKNQTEQPVTSITKDTNMSVKRTTSELDTSSIHK